MLVGENTQRHNPDAPDTTEDKHSETAKETDDTNDVDDVPMSETPVSDGRHPSHIKYKSSAADTDGVRQRLKFDGEASAMTPDPKRSKETVKRGEFRESNALPGESPDGVADEHMEDVDAKESHASSSADPAVEPPAEAGTTPATVLKACSSIKELHSVLRELGAPDLRSEVRALSTAVRIRTHRSQEEEGGVSG